MMRMLRIAIVPGLALGLAACESLGQAAESTQTTLGSWFESAKGAFGGNDARANQLARAVGDDVPESDVIALEREFARVLETAAAGETVEWRAPESGVQAVLTAGDPVMEKRTMPAVLAKGIDQPAELKVIGQTYRALYTSNLRTAPGIEHRVVGLLTKGEQFTALGKLTSEEWILVGRNNRAVGYVYAPLVEAATLGQDAPTLRQGQELQPAGDDENVTVATITVATACRSLAYSLTTAGGEHRRDSLEACKSGDGAWEVR